jgi:tetratricopeptide (TPR) repeat protein
VKSLLKTVRTVTLAVALVSLVFYLGGSDPKAELATAEYAYRHYDYDQAIRFARRAALMSDGKSEAKAWLVAAEAARKMEHHEAALKYLNRAIGVWPDCGRCYLKRGELHYAQKAYDRSIEDFNRAFERIGAFSPQEAAKYSARRAVAYLRLGKVEEGCRDGEFAIRSDDSSPLAHFAEAICLYERDDLEKAAKSAERAYNLGMAYPFFFTKEREEAGEDWLKVYTALTLEAARKRR